jgi:hypothetical protein
MKKIIIALFALILIIVIVVTVAGWFRLQRLQNEATTAFGTLTDVYIVIDKDSVSVLENLPTLTTKEHSSIAQYRAAIAATKNAEALPQLVEHLRTAQGIGFDLFGTSPASASGSLGASVSYQAWRKDTSDAGKVFPVILQYNQAAKSLNDELAMWPVSMFAALLNIKPLVLIDVNGKPFENRPSRI